MPEQEHIDFVFGDRSNSFELAFNEDGLARFVGLATRALAEAKVLRDNDEAVVAGAGVGLVGP
ncbi:hypothetical protein [Actinokineospora sp.]|uniref:hypothetical protein n=1 Tax=Actinokineospora sp. TaxID=1872133 RepID=UPI004037D6A9